MSCSTFLPSVIKIFQRVFNLQSGHEINAWSLLNISKRDNAKSKKGRDHACMQHTISCPVLHFCQVQPKYSEGFSSYRADTKIISNKTNGDNTKSKKARVVILVHDTSSCLVLHFYQVSSNFSQGYSSYRADKFYAYADADADANGIRPKNNISPSFIRGT